MFLRKDPCGIICILFTYAMLLHCLYVIIYLIIIPYLNDSFYGTLNAIVICTFILLCILSHGRASYFDPGFVTLPKKGLDFSDVKIGETSSKNTDDEWTVCNRCDTYRPARSHHCKICRRCVRKMDHHCPWINNCVGEYNQKYFILFLLYIGVTSFYVLSLVIWALIVFATKSDMLIFNSIIIIIESGLFGIFVSSMLYDQIQSILNDRSLIDTLKSDDHTRTSSRLLPTKYILFRQVFGAGPMICWFFPCDLTNSNSISDAQEMYHV